MQQLLTCRRKRNNSCGNKMCRKPWHPQVNKQLRKEAMRNIVDAKLLSLGK